MFSCQRKKREKIERYLEVNANPDTTYLNLWDTAKAVLREKFIAMSVYVENTENISNKRLYATSQTPRKTRTSKPKTSRRKEIIKIRAEMNEVETKKKRNTKNSMKKYLVL
jgi:hypothetical protein